MGSGGGNFGGGGGEGHKGRVYLMLISVFASATRTLAVHFSFLVMHDGMHPCVSAKLEHALGYAMICRRTSKKRYDDN